MAYNGWTNKATWQINLWYGDVFANIAEDGPVTADFMREYVAEVEGIDDMKDGFAKDAALAAFHEVDWYELEDHYVVLSPEEEDEEEEAA